MVDRRVLGTWELAVVLLLAGCSTSGASTAGPSVSPTSRATSPQPASGASAAATTLSASVQTDLARRLMTAREYRQMAAVESPTYETLTQAASASIPAWLLTSEGFVGAAAEHWVSQYTNGAIADVTEFATAAGAAKAAQSVLSAAGPEKQVSFPIPGVPDAFGFDVYSGSQVSDRNVVFTDGDYLYVFGFEADPQQLAKAPTRAQMIADAEAWYQRVHRL
jgi:hypothetical protein